MMQKFNPEKTKYVKLADAVLSVFFHEQLKKKVAAQPLNIPDMESILVIEAGRIGDIVMSIPFLKTLRRNAPAAKITVVCGRWAEAVLKGQGLADRLIFMDTEAFASPLAMLKRHRKLRQTLRQVNTKQYDLALEPRGDLRYLFFLHVCHAHRKAGYRYTGGEYLLTDVLLPPQKTVHLVEERLYFAKQAGCRLYRADRYPQLSLNAAQKEENKAFIRRHGLEGKRIIGIHPGAGLQIKQWDGFEELAARLARDSGRRAFLVFEGPGETEAAEKTAKAVRAHGAQAVVIRTGLARYMQRLALCHAVICNDSSAGHLARAYGVTVFVIFGPVEPAFARPYAKDRVYVFSDDSLPCKPCFRTACPARYGSGTCLKKITVRQVYETYLSAESAGLLSGPEIPADRKGAMPCPQ